MIKTFKIFLIRLGSCFLRFAFTSLRCFLLLVKFEIKFILLVLLWNFVKILHSLALEICVYYISLFTTSLFLKGLAPIKFFLIIFFHQAGSLCWFSSLFWLTSKITKFQSFLVFKFVLCVGFGFIYQSLRLIFFLINYAQFLRTSFNFFWELFLVVSFFPPKKSSSSY